MGVVAAFPWESSAEGLEPGIESNGDDEELPDWVENGTQITLAESVGYGESQGKDDSDLGPYQGSAVRGEKKNEGNKKYHNLNSLKQKKGRKVFIKAWVEIFCKTFPDF